MAEKMKYEAVAVLDFGGHNAQLIARRVRELGEYCVIKNYGTKAEQLKEYKGIIFTGGDGSVKADGAADCDPRIFELSVPILGIGYGATVIAEAMGGKVLTGGSGEAGDTAIRYSTSSRLFKNLPQGSAYQSRGDSIEDLPEGFSVTAVTEGCPIAAFENEEKQMYGLMLHPETERTENGAEIFRNFLFEICGCEGNWEMAAFTRDAVQQIKDQVGDKRVLCALSGGVDSSVAAVLVHKAIGKNLTCIFVDHGLMRKDEGDMVETVFKREFDMNLIRVNAQERFLSKLKGVTEPEKKRKIIGEEFIRVFEEESAKLGEMEFLCQGTIYPDIAESGTGKGDVIKSHHNVGGLPEDIGFEGLVEPLKELFKDEVRAVGTELGIPHDLVWRQPFPGPGLGVRVIGEITAERLDVLREADAIFRGEIAAAGLDETVNQYFAVLTESRSVGAGADGRTYGVTVALRAVVTTDFMTARWARLPYELLDRASTRITDEVAGVSRVVYDITGKPPATIEWE